MPRYLALLQPGSQGGDGGLQRHLRRLASLPDLGDPAERLSAHLVARTIDLLIVSVILFALARAVAPSPWPAQYALTLPISLAFLLVMRWQLHRGRVRRVAKVLCAIGWVVVGLDLPTYGPNTVSLGGFVVLILIGGLTLGATAATMLSAATIALYVPFLLGWVPGPFAAYGRPERLVHYATQLVLAAVLTAWWARRTRKLLADLRQSEAWRTLLLEESPDAIVSTDLAGVTTFQNRAAYELLGEPGAEGGQRPWTTLAPGQQGSSALREVAFTRRDGRAVVVEAKAAALREEGTAVGTLSILRDVTDRKRSEVERDALQRQLASAQRMEAMGRIAGGVAHDFNNLLTIVLGAVDSIGSTGGAADGALDDVREAARRGTLLTRQLLAFSRPHLAHPRLTDVNGAIRTIRPVLERLVGHGITLEVRLAPSLPAVLVDRGQLDQVLLNLTANARDAMSGGGTLTIATASKDDEPTVEIGVADTGHGMDSDTLASIFEPFYTTKGEHGTGLGLAVVHSVVRAAGGTVTAESEPGVGSIFRVALPASARVPPPASPRSVRAASVSWRVALVDDDPLVRRAIHASLSRSVCAVEDVDAPSDLAGVPAVAARLARVDALITDVVMPGVSGVDLALELRRQGCNVPILFVSGYAEHRLIERAREVSRSQLIQKPIDVDDVRKRLEQLIGDKCTPSS
ncbi:MAG TPA: ATP-binding protein [Polyangiaceae bacterium]|nr:ATP-binding protein [Polyangiaceae bacterium]